MSALVSGPRGSERSLKCVGLRAGTLQWSRSRVGDSAHVLSAGVTLSPLAGGGGLGCCDALWPPKLRPARQRDVSGPTVALAHDRQGRHCGVAAPRPREPRLRVERAGLARGPARAALSGRAPFLCPPLLPQRLRPGSHPALPPARPALGGPDPRLLRSLPVSGLRAGGRGRGRAFRAASCQRCVSGLAWGLRQHPQPLKEAQQGLGSSLSGAYNAFFLAPEVEEQKLMTEKVPGLFHPPRLFPPLPGRPQPLSVPSRTPARASHTPPLTSRTPSPDLTHTSPDLTPQPLP